MKYQPDGSGLSPGFMIDSTSSASLDSACVLRVENAFSSRTAEFGESRSRYVQRIPLRAVDLNSVHVEHHQSPPGLYSLEPYVSVVLSIADGRLLVEKTDSVITRDRATPANRPNSERTRVPRASIPARDEQAADRIAHALRRAVELCGGRKEAF
jgi:hypothetical protein